MFGTIARLRIKPGMDARMLELSHEYDTLDIPGFRGDLVYQSDDDPRVWYMVVVFESREAYVANAEDPAQDARYARFRELLDADPEWNDGAIVYNTLV